MMKRLLFAFILSVSFFCNAFAAAEGYPVRGRVIDHLSRQPIAYAAVYIDGQPDRGATTDSLGQFVIERVRRASIGSGPRTSVTKRS